MEEKIYYPAYFFADIVMYFGGSEVYIEEEMNNNIVKTKTNKLSELKNLLEGLTISKKNDNRLGIGILTDLENIKENEKETKKIKKIERIIDKLKSMDQIDEDVSKKIFLKIQFLSENTGKTGYSDSSILRYMDKNQNALSEEKYNDIIDYLINPDAQNDYSALSNHLLSCIGDSNYNGIPQEKIDIITQMLERKDFSGKHILRIFRILEQCSHGFSKKANKKVQENIKVVDDWEITNHITKKLQSIWGDIETESIGITKEEKNKISFDVSQELLKDYEFYRKITNVNIESLRGYRALIFYRLYHKIFYYMEINDNNKEDSEEMQKALAFFAFSILQRAIEHTEILLHPAARIGVPVYVGDRVMVGKQCEIEEECILGKNVCLYPFNIYGREISGQDMYIIVGKKTIFYKNTKVLGRIRIGQECIIDKPILIDESIEDKKYVYNQEVKEIGELKQSDMLEGIL